MEGERTGQELLQYNMEIILLEFINLVNKSSNLYLSPSGLHLALIHYISFHYLVTSIYSDMNPYHFNSRFLLKYIKYY